MATLSIPNTIANGQPADASKVQQNFDAVKTFANTELINRDGSVAMTQPLTLVAPSTANHAARKTDVDAAIPVGSVIMYGGTTEPSAQWLFCRGQAVSRSGYAALFAIISTAYGIGDGSSTFNLPNFQGTVPVGFNSGTNPPSGLAGKFTAGLGERIGVVDAIVVAHTHSVSATTGNESVDHAHGVSITTGNQSVLHTHGVNGTISNATAGGSVTALVNSVGGSNAATTLTESAFHTHDVNGATGGRNAAHTHSFSTTSSTTGSSAVNANIQPSLSINYLIRALAA